MNLVGKLALVTGGSSGIGRAIAESLLEAGCEVIITYNSQNINNSKFIKFPVDLHSEESIKNLFDSIARQFGKLDILVNSAGINAAGQPFDLLAWREVFEIDLFALVSVTGKAVDLMKNGGKIINISSIYGEGKAAWKGLVAYSAAKASVNNFTQTLAKNLAPKILVNAIAPGYVRTPMWGIRTEEEFESNGKEQLIERMIMPEEIAEMALAIIKSDAMTGEIVVVDGGISLKTI